MTQSRIYRRRREKTKISRLHFLIAEKDTTQHNHFSRQLPSNSTMIPKSSFRLIVIGLLSGCGAAFSLNGASTPNKNDATTSALSRKNFLQVASAAAGAAVAGGTLLPQMSHAASAPDVNVGGKLRFGDESIMSPKEHGTSAKPVQSDLMYDVSNKLADKVRSQRRRGLICALVLRKVF